MKAIQIEQRSEESGTETQYVVQIDGKWHKVICVETSILDSRYAQSDNVYKWDNLGQLFRFSVEPCESPEQELPKQVEEFLKRCKETGDRSAVLKEPREGEHRPQLDRYPGHTWGWEKDPERLGRHHRWSTTD